MKSKKRDARALFIAERPRMFPFPVLIATVLLLAGCAATGPRSASGTPLPAGALIRAEEQVRNEGIPEPLRPYHVALYSEGRQNSVLHAMRAGMASFRMGDWDRAARLWDRAIAEVEEMQEGARQAERAKSKFVAEQEKWFKGESYERAALYFYRGLLYLRAGDYGNAAACFKRSQLQDITGDDAPDFAGDWASNELLLAWTHYLEKRPAEAEAVLARLDPDGKQYPGVARPGPETNVLVVVELGEGPLKYRAGRQGEQLRYLDRPTPVVRVKAVPDGTETMAAENLYHQATTRGQRQIDYILAGKASFKEDTGNAAAALATGAVVASQTNDGGLAAGILGLAALGTWIASESTRSEADVRCWDSLPRLVFLLPLKLPPGTTSIELATLDASGKVLNKKTVTDVPSSATPTSPGLVFVRMNPL